MNPDGRSARRLAIYSHDSVGLGHLRRCLHLARCAVEADPSVEVLLVSGSPRARSFTLPRGVSVVKLPSVGKDPQGRYRTRGGGVPLEKTIAMRKRQLRRALEAFAPDVLVVDHVPFGLQGELLPLLVDLGRGARPVRRVLGLRDILDEPRRVRSDWSYSGVPEALGALYDDVVVYGDRAVFDLAALYGLDARVSGRLRYLGYLGRSPGIPRPSLSTEFAQPDRPHVLCTVGGGEDGFSIVRAFVEASVARDEWNATLVVGPFLQPSLRDYLVDAPSSSALHVLKFTDEFESLMRGTDAVVSMGGYNTVVEGLSAGRRMLLVPRKTPRQEQWLRAQAFGERGLLSMFEPEGLEGGGLGAAIHELLASPVPPTPQAQGIHWQGGQRFAELVLGTAGVAAPDRVNQVRA